jgi:hypothetical protein
MNGRYVHLLKPKTKPIVLKPLRHRLGSTEGRLSDLVLRLNEIREEA